MTNVVLGFFTFHSLISPDDGKVDDKVFKRLIKQLTESDKKQTAPNSEKYIIEVNGKPKININKLIQDSKVGRSAIENLNTQILSKSAEQIFYLDKGIEMDLNFVNAIESSYNKAIKNVNEFVKAVDDRKLYLTRDSINDQDIFISANVLWNVTENSVNDVDELMKSTFGNLLVKRLLAVQSFNKFANGCIKSLKTLQNDPKMNDLIADLGYYTIQPSSIKALINDRPDALAQGAFKGFDINNEQDRKFLGLDESLKPRSFASNKVKFFLFYYVLGGFIFGDYGKRYLRAIEVDKKYNQYFDKVSNLINQDNLKAKLSGYENNHQFSILEGKKVDESKNQGNVFARFKGNNKQKLSQK